MLKIAILEDNTIDAELLSDLLQKYAKTHQLSFEIVHFDTEDGLLSCECLKEFKIFFLDILIDGVGKGVSAARALREKVSDALIVFLSVTSDYAIESYRVRAFDYLLKPCTPDQIEETMDLCLKKLVIKKQAIQVKESRLYIDIPLDNIIYTDYHNHYIHIHTKVRTVKSYMRFSDFSKLLLIYPQFLHCYRNCIINMDYVKQMKENDFLMENGDCIPISRKDKPQIRQTFADYEFQKL